MIKINPAHIYALVILIYGVIDVAIQKNKKSIVTIGTKDRTYLPVFITFIITFVAVYLEFRLLEKQVSWPMMVAGSMVCLLATCLRVKAHLDLKSGFSTRVEKQKDHVLVTTGIYSMIRHPMYLALLAMQGGACIMMKSVFSWIFIILNYFPLYIRIRKEEAFLKENFHEYAEYMQKTYRLIPFIY